MDLLCHLSVLRVQRTSSTVEREGALGTKPEANEKVKEFEENGEGETVARTAGNNLEKNMQMLVLCATQSC